MWIILIISFILLVYLIGTALDEEFTEVLPVAYGGLILVLYVLAYARSMLLIRGMLIAALLLFVAAVGMMGKDGRASLVTSLKTFFINTRSICIMLCIAGIVLMTASHVVSWWDDINYWATDAKALYYLNGFTGKYGNVAPEFGDYPPALQLAKWCITSLQQHTYIEGLTFVGYYLMNFIFLLPLYSVLGKKGRITNIIGMVGVMLLPGVVNNVWSFGACADVTMGIVYGALLISIVDISNHRAGFYYTRIGILLSVLYLTKSVGFEWAIFGSVFFIVFMIVRKKDLLSCYGEKYRVYSVLALLTGASFQISWWINCLVNRRIAKLTSSGVHMAASGYNPTNSIREKIAVFVKGWALCPMHTDDGVTLDLSAMTMMVIVLAVLIAMAIKKITSKSESKLLIIFAFITGLITYGVIFAGHVTIFSGETQYDTPEVMAISISRYGTPFTLGMLMLLIYVAIDRINVRWMTLGVLIAILITTDYPAIYNAAWGHRYKAAEEEAIRWNMVDEAGRIYIEEIDGDERLWGHRVLYFRDATSIHWVHDAYVNHAAAPVPTVYTNIDPTTMTADVVRDEIERNHAEYIYVDDVSCLETGLTGKEIFGELIDIENANQFGYCKVYHVR